MREASNIQEKSDFALRVSKTIGMDVLAKKISISVSELKSRIHGFTSFSDAEIESVYQALCIETKTSESSHV